jgi:anti-sigma factor RsiW
MMDEQRLVRVLAYVDGELAPAERAAFEREMAADPGLAAEVAGHRALARKVGGAYAPVLDEPVPLALTLAASAANEGRRGWAPAQWAAVAASLVVGVLVGRGLLTPPRTPGRSG